MQESFMLIPTDELNKIQQQLSELRFLILQKQDPKETNLGDWISQEKAIQLLGIKETSLYKLRKAGKLIATQTRPIFYSLQSIQSYLKELSQ